MKRHEVTRYAGVDPPHLSRRTAKKGRLPSDLSVMLNGILWILRIGAWWRDLPEQIAPWQAAYDDFARWRREGAYDRIPEALLIRLDADGEIDWDLWCIDGS